MTDEIIKIEDAIQAIETKVYVNLEKNPFDQHISDYHFDVDDAYSNYMRSNENVKESAIELAARLTLLISKLP